MVADMHAPHEVWRPLTETIPARPRRFATVSPTASGAVLFGGLSGREAVADAWRWDGQRWHPLASEGAPSPRAGHAAASSPGGVCIWGGRGVGGLRDDGACWDAAHNTWTPLPSDGGLPARADAMMAWDGRGYVLFGGRDDEDESWGDGVRWVPGEAAWSPLPEGPRARHRGLLASATGRWAEGDAGLVLVGGAGEALALGAEDAALWQPAAGQWRGLDREGVPSASEGPVCVATAVGPVVLGATEARRYDAARGQWEPLPTAGMPPLRLGAAVVATDRALVVWGGRELDGDRGDGAVLDLRSRVWMALPAGPAPRRDATLLAAGDRVLLLWGHDDVGPRSDAWLLDLDALRATHRAP